MVEIFFLIKYFFQEIWPGLPQHMFTEFALLSFMRNLKNISLITGLACCITNMIHFVLLDLLRAIPGT